MYTYVYISLKERVAVEVARDITRNPGVGVVVPCTTYNNNIHLHLHHHPYQPLQLVLYRTPSKGSRPTILHS